MATSTEIRSPVELANSVLQSSKGMVSAMLTTGNPVYDALRHSHPNDRMAILQALRKDSEGIRRRMGHYRHTSDGKPTLPYTQKRYQRLVEILRNDERRSTAELVKSVERTLQSGGTHRLSRYRAALNLLAEYLKDMTESSNAFLLSGGSHGRYAISTKLHDEVTDQLRLQLKLVDHLIRNT